MRWLRSERDRAAHAHPVHEDQRRTAWAACAALLDYPTPELLSDLPGIDAEVASLPEVVSAPLGRLIQHLAGHDLRTLQEQYVATFDHTRRCALYLSYFDYGDTRRRGVALVQFKQAYRKAGVEFDEDAQELPDHLCVVLQFGAVHDPDGAWDLLLDHRAGIEMLRLALAAEDSPWHDVLVALCATLPPLRGEDEDAVRRLIQDGPPAEEVGLEPYALAPTRPQPQFVGMPTGGH